MSQKNIHDFFTNSIENISSLISELKVVGDPLYLAKGEVLIPLSKVTMGFCTGGGEYKVTKSSLDDFSDYPFGGGSVGGITLIPEAFIYIYDHHASVVNVKEQPNIYQKAIDLFIQVAKSKLKK